MSNCQVEKSAKINLRKTIDGQAAPIWAWPCSFILARVLSGAFYLISVVLVHAHHISRVCTGQGYIPFFIYKLNTRKMPIPSIKSICIFVILNTLCIIIFNLNLTHYETFIADERFSGTLAVNFVTLFKLGTAFVLTVFTLNILLFKFVLRIQNTPIYSSIKVSLGVILLGSLVKAIILWY